MSLTPTVFVTFQGHVKYLQDHTASIKETGDPGEITQGCTLYLWKLAEATNVVICSSNLYAHICSLINKLALLVRLCLPMPTEFTKLAGVTCQIKDLPTIAASTLPMPGNSPSQEGPKKKGKKGKRSSKTNGAILDLSQEEVSDSSATQIDAFLAKKEAPSISSNSGKTLASTAQAMKEAVLYSSLSTQNRPHAEHNLLDDEAATATSQSIKQAASEWKSANLGSREEHVKSCSLQLTLLQEDKADYMFRMCYYEHWYSRCVQQIRETEELLANDVE
ncbi:hypothetical protein M413DRAFT_433804 [Hebeloma cylindrosporum]|uniref:Uncharacterized protein n=1 Tax=Hebeloma cylindrosporum TaxID=76867 RepID=A0A0C2XAD7_HEBCY|nr:hypothetical protein M413DRAFT_433804 [Hebeloma cylindrosporum h7]